MASKAINTGLAGRPCDVCGRTLLGGEHADVFIAGGSRRVVCDLCVARAAHEGWIREGVDDSLAVRPRSDRGRSMLGRLRSRREDRREPSLELSDPATAADSAVADLDSADAASAPNGRAIQSSAIEGQEPRRVHAVPTNADLKMARALEVFNASEHPRTVSGVARSLGPPFVAVHPAGATGSMVSIVIGWELCWYRYEVDLADEASGVRVVAQGDDVAELDGVATDPNAAADERGELHPASA